MGNPLAAAPGSDEEAGKEPHDLVFIGCTIPHDLALGTGGRDISRPRAAGAPADRLSALRGQDSHRCRASGSHCPEPPLVAAVEPTSRELAASYAERHAPAAASSPLTLEQSRQVRQIFRSQGP